MLKKEKGITLIALIITIVVLLILAGITITGSIQGVDKANNNKLITDLDKVHHAITERETKYKLTKDESLLIGTVVKSSNIDVTGLSESEKITWKMLDFDGVTDPERDYYRLSGSDLVQLGLTSDPTTTTVYVVNYFTGEAYNETQKKTEDGKLLYVTSTTEQVSEMGDEIIKDGLLVWYDGENNTGSGHSSTTTVWKDLSGNGNDATLYGFDGTNPEESGWHSDYLAFDGQNDYVTGALNTNGDITVEFIIKNNNLNSTATMYMFNSWGGNVLNPTMQLYSTNNEVIPRMLVPPNNNDSFKELYKSALGSISNTNIFNSSITKNNNSIITYNNGSTLNKFTDNSFIDRFYITDINFTIGKWHSLNSYFSNQNVYAMRVYNRALTANEVKHNYLIDKARFGIEE